MSLPPDLPVPYLCCQAQHLLTKAPICPRRERIHKVRVHDYDDRGRQRLRSSCKGQLLDLIPVQ